MKTWKISTAVAVTCVGMAFALGAATPVRGIPDGCDPSVMSEAYWKLWSDEVRAKFDADIEKYRKADVEFSVGAPAGTEVEVEQVAHAFRFGAHAFLVGRQPTEEINRRYEENFVRLFNQATIAFYWRAFEASPGDPHFHTRPGDLESAFTSGERDKMDARSRYLSSPARSTDQFLEFAKSHDMIVHGHPLVWGSEEWMMPFWLYDQYCPEAEKAFLRLPRKDFRTITRQYGEKDWVDAYRARMKELTTRYSEAEIAAHCPVYFANMKRLLAKRIAEIMDYCGDRVDSWDVVNESVHDARKRGERTFCVQKSRYGLMPGNYVFDAFKTAAAHAGAKTLLGINDNNSWSRYVEQIADLRARGTRIDLIGAQFHIFWDELFRSHVAGKENLGFPSVSTPKAIVEQFKALGQFGLPVHLSEITIPAPGDTKIGRQQQAIVAADLYRAWFAQPSCCGITWWHTLDGANKGGGSENGFAGLMDAEARPKPSYHALYNLIHGVWKTRLTAKADANGKIAFRGFRGKYRLTWKSADGTADVREVFVK